LIGYWNGRPSSKTTKIPTETKDGVGGAVVAAVAVDS
jgi:hypothetical protein